MWNPLIQFLFDAIPGSGDAVLRYNFRGTGESEGAYDNGVGEREDAAAAFDAATQLVDGPVLSVGWSFGAVVSLHADHDRLAGWVGIAAPLQMMTEAPASASQERPKLLLVPEHDQFCRPEAAVEATVGWNAATVVTLAGTDHSVAGRAQDVAEAIATFAR